MVYPALTHMNRP